MSGGTPLGRPVDLVIFDCDGVLIESEVIAIQCLLDRLATIAPPMDFATACRQFVGRGWDGIRRMIEADIGHSLPDGFEDDVEHDAMAQMASSLTPTTGIAAALERLELPRCVASGSSVEWITHGLMTTGLLDHLAPHLFSASMVENGKPAPDVFLHAAKEMGVAPTTALVVEDSLPGVEAGVAAGTTVIGFVGGRHIVDKADHAEQLRAAGASLVIDDMRALLEVIGA